MDRRKQIAFYGSVRFRIARAVHRQRKVFETMHFRMDHFHHVSAPPGVDGRLDALRLQLQDMRDVLMNAVTDLKTAVSKLTADVATFVGDSQTASAAIRAALQQANTKLDAVQTNLASVTADDDAQRVALAAANQTITELRAQLADATGATSDLLDAVNNADAAVTSADAALNPPTDTTQPSPTGPSAE